MTEFQAVLIAGPTASGKSARAMELAREMNGVIINANSMAVYQDLPILSARPTPEDIAGTPHLLFGHIGAERNYSVGQWLDDAGLALEKARAEKRMPMFVGGTGMYFKALLQGLSDIPKVPDEVRARVRAESAGLPPAELYARLQKFRPADRWASAPTDPQRILRALEIFAATGAPLASFHNARGKPLLDVRVVTACSSPLKRKS